MYLQATLAATVLLLNKSQHDAKSKDGRKEDGNY